MYRTLGPPLEAAQQAAPGLHLLSEEETAPVGRTYRLRVFRGVWGPTDSAVERLLRDFLRPDPREIVFYSDAVRTESHSAAIFRDFLSLRDAQLSTAEQQSIAELARCFAQAVAASNLTVYLVEAGWADAVGSAFHGVLAVDIETGEVLWLHVFAAWTV